MFIVSYVSRWHEGVQSSNGPISSCFKGFSGTRKEVSSYLCTSSATHFDIPWYMWFMSCCLYTKIYQLLFICYPGGSGCLPSGMWKFEYRKRCGICCGCDNQIIAFLKYLNIVLIIDYRVMDNHMRLCVHDRLELLSASMLYYISFCIIYFFHLMPVSFQFLVMFLLVFGRI
jgi:hypothetical protein